MPLIDLSRHEIIRDKQIARAEELCKRYTLAAKKKYESLQVYYEKQKDISIKKAQAIYASKQKLAEKYNESESEEEKEQETPLTQEEGEEKKEEELQGDEKIKTDSGSEGEDQAGQIGGGEYPGEPPPLPPASSLPATLSLENIFSSPAPRPIPRRPYIPSSSVPYQTVKQITAPKVPFNQRVNIMLNKPMYQ